ncbi:hypothetical protein GDO86_015288 [Hymenochirus boettgeri]|uniref:Uncharacterized protein n=1 Tax=Hymenochirus boettgeri TaxID=247094 RepID=A0A8T2JWV0_9PIPI|nr:hypothetical protein GDO86_015288 [Hymenochirus boettgeri]
MYRNIQIIIYPNVCYIIYIFFFQPLSAFAYKEISKMATNCTEVKKQNMYDVLKVLPKPMWNSGLFIMGMYSISKNWYLAHICFGLKYCRYLIKVD